MSLDLTKLDAADVHDVSQAMNADVVDVATCTPEQFVRLYAQWHLGSSEWGSIFYTLIRQLHEAEVKPTLLQAERGR